MKRILCLTLVILFASIGAFSDIARPDKTPKPTPKFKMTNTVSTMSIRMDANANMATLRIPKADLKALAALENGDDDNTAAATSSFSRTQTVISGAFLSLALVFGGMWFVQSGKSATKAGKTLIILAIIGVVGSAATFVYANAGPPPVLRSISSKLFDKKVFQYWNRASGGIRVESSPGDTIELIVPDPPETAKPGGEE